MIEEFVQVDSDEELDSDNKEKFEENKDQDDIMVDNENCQVNTKPHKVKTHFEIEDVSSLINRIYFIYEFMDHF